MKQHAHDSNGVDAAWVNKPEALQLLGVSERSLDRLVTASKVQKQTRPRPGRTPEPVYYRPDIERITAVDAFPVPADDGNRQLAVAPPAGITTSVTQALAIMEAVRSTYAVQAPPPPPPQAWIDVEAASAHSGLSVRLLRKLIREGGLAALRDGKAWKVHREDLDNLRPRRLAAAREIQRREEDDRARGATPNAKARSVGGGAK